MFYTACIKHLENIECMLVKCVCQLLIMSIYLAWLLMGSSPPYLYHGSAPIFCWGQRPRPSMPPYLRTLVTLMASALQRSVDVPRGLRPTPTWKRPPGRPYVNPDGPQQDRTVQLENYMYRYGRQHIIRYSDHRHDRRWQAQRTVVSE